MEEYLESTEIIDYTHPNVAAKARELAQWCSNDAEITNHCFEFVRDVIRHTGDAGEGLARFWVSHARIQGWA